MQLKIKNFLLTVLYMLSFAQGRYQNLLAITIGKLAIHYFRSTFGFWWWQEAIVECGIGNGLESN